MRRLLGALKVLILLQSCVVDLTLHLNANIADVVFIWALHVKGVIIINCDRTSLMNAW